MVARSRNANTQSFELQLRTYDYLEDPSFVNPDTLAILSIPAGVTQWDGVKLLADTIRNVSKAWKSISFATPFDVTPVVFCTQISNNDPTASAIRIRNITRNGFQICRKYESGKPNVMEDVTFIAATPGVVSLTSNRFIEIGIANPVNADDGVSYTKPLKIDFQQVHENPCLFAFMQTANDETASALRIKSRNSRSAEIFKEKEKSTNSTTPAAEQIAYMVLGDNTGSTAIPQVITSGKHLLYDRANEQIYLSDKTPIDLATVYSILGTKILSVTGGNTLSVKTLPRGIYIAVINGFSLKFIK
jgi:hypothetical protein